MPEENSLYTVCVNITLSCVSHRITSKNPVEFQLKVYFQEWLYGFTAQAYVRQKGGWLQLLYNVQLGAVTGAWHGPQKLNYMEMCRCC